MSSQQTHGLSQRFHNWLDEPEGQIFTRGKWKFWLPAMLGFSVLNAVLTVLIFGETSNLQNYLGAVILGAAALVGWIAIGCLHYSDAKQGKMGFV